MSEELPEKRLAEKRLESRLKDKAPLYTHGEAVTEANLAQRNALLDYEERHGYRGPEAHRTLPKETVQETTQENVLESVKEAVQEAVQQLLRLVHGS